MEGRKMSIIGILIFIIVLSYGGRSAAYNGNKNFEKVIDNLADLAVLVDGDRIILTGTGANTNHISFYQTTNLKDFTFIQGSDYNPSYIDTAFNYCNIWGAGIGRYEGKIELYFSAVRYSKNGQCSSEGEASYVAKGDSLSTLGAPQEMHYYVGEEHYGTNASTIREDRHNFVLAGARENGRIFWNPIAPNEVWSFRPTGVGPGGKHYAEDVIKHSWPIDHREKGVNEGGRLRNINGK